MFSLRSQFDQLLQFYPLMEKIWFIRADFDEIKELFDTYPHFWEGCPSRISDTYRHMYPKRFRGEGVAEIDEWWDLLVPQNRHRRYLIVDTVHSEWTALVAANTSEDLGNELNLELQLRRDFAALQPDRGIEFQTVGVTVSVPTQYWLDTPNYHLGPSIEVKLGATDGQWVDPKDGSWRLAYYAPGWIMDMPGKLYEFRCRANGYWGHEGFDQPVVLSLPEPWEQAPSWWGENNGPVEEPGRHGPVGFKGNIRRGLGEHWSDIITAGFQNDLGSFLNEKSEKAEIDFCHSAVPFEFPYQGKIMDSFNSTILAHTLRDSFGIRWDDPSFYQGRYALYVAEPEERFDDVFTPWISNEEFIEREAFALDYMTDLVKKGKF